MALTKHKISTILGCFALISILLFSATSANAGPFAKLKEKFQAWLTRRDNVQLVQSRANLTNHNLTGLDLTGLELRYDTYTNRLVRLNMTGTILNRAYLYQVRGIGADFTNTIWNGAQLIRVVMRHANFNGATFTNTEILGDFDRATWVNATLTNVTLSGDFRDADWRGTIFHNVTITIHHETELGQVRVDRHTELPPYREGEHRGLAAFRAEVERQREEYERQQRELATFAFNTLIQEHDQEKRPLAAPFLNLVLRALGVVKPLTHKEEMARRANETNVTLGNGKPPRGPDDGPPPPPPSGGGALFAGSY